MSNSPLLLPVRTIKVVWGNRSRDVMIVKTGDKIWDSELEEWARERTLEQLKKLPPLPIHSVEHKKEVANAMKEFNEWRRKKRDR